MTKQPKKRAGGFRKARLAACLIAAGLALTGTQARADAEVALPPALARGINITHWFRFPPSNRARAMADHLDDASLAALRHAGFTYIRLSVGPEEVMQGHSIAPDKLAALTGAIGRIEHAGLAVMVEPHPEQMQHWNLQRNADARAALLGFWHDLAPALKPFPVAATFPELVNEPGFDDAAQWDAYQRQLLAVVRNALPSNTVILTGTNWSSIDGLLKVKPVEDRNVIYSFHTYEPQVLTLLAFWDGAAKKDQLAQNLPFPAKDEAACKAAVAGIKDAHTLAIGQFWCSMHSDAASVRKNLARAATWGSTHHVAVAMTEFGAVQQLQSRARLPYLSAVRTAGEQLGLSWAIWGLDDQMGFGLQPGSFHTASQLSPGIMQALGLPAR